eukprot:Gb_38532 [translate_table: standard]
MRIRNHRTSSSIGHGLSTSSSDQSHPRHLQHKMCDPNALIAHSSNHHENASKNLCISSSLSSSSSTPAHNDYPSAITQTNPNAVTAAQQCKFTARPTESMVPTYEVTENVKSNGDLASVLSNHNATVSVADATEELSIISDTHEILQAESFRVCRLNQSRWDVPAFVRAFEKECTELESIQHHQQKKKKNKLGCTSSCVNGLPYHCPQAQTNGRRKHVLNEENVEALQEELLTSALQKVLSEAGDGGLTVREAGYKLLQLKKEDVFKSLYGGLPLSVKVRRAMLKSPYFVELGEGRFALWDSYLSKYKSSEGLDTLIVGNQVEKCREQLDGQESDIDNEIKQLAVSSNMIKSKGKRSRRMGMVRKEAGVLMSICMKETDGLCAEGFSSACEEDLKRMKSIDEDHHLCANNNNNDYNVCSWDSSFDCPYYYYTGFGPSSATSDAIRNEEYVGKTSNGRSVREISQKERHKAPLVETLAQCMLLPHAVQTVSSEHPYRQRKPVKARSLKSIV